MNNRGAEIRALVSRIPSWDHVQLEPIRLEPPSPRAKRIDLPIGGIWRHNRKRAQEGEAANRKSGDDFIDCLYDLRDSGRHTVRSYGLGRTVPNGELSRLHIDEQTARRFAEYLRRTKAYSPEDAKPLERLHADLIASYGAKRDENKVTARERWLRGAVTTDSLGKANPMAAALVTYAGIRHLVKREGEIPKIATAVDGKTLLVDAYIQDHLALYKELWDALVMSDHLHTRGAFQILLDNSEDSVRTQHLPQSQRGAQALNALEEMLVEYDSAFSSIVARPFCRNANHTRNDITIAIELVRKGDRNGVRQQIAKIRQGIRWVFALDHLREKVITPLSFLIEHLRDKEIARLRAERRKTIAAGGSIPRTKREPIRVTREMAPAAFAEIEKNIKRFLAKLSKCSDEDLKTKVKTDVVAHAQDALRAMESDQWVLAKKRLRVAAKKL